MSKTAYSITIENRTSRQIQSYVIFSQPPQVVGLVQGRIWPVVVSKTHVAAAQSGTFRIMSKYYQAFCGLVARTPSHGSETVAYDHRAVSLGDKKIDGSQTPGTSLNMLTARQDRPEFPRATPSPNAGVGAFEIVTGDDFTAQDARDENWIIGYGVYPKAVPRSSPAACFIPEPNTKYTIKPSHTYYVACGTFEVGSIINPDLISGACKIDFSSLPSGDLNVSLVHDENGTLRIR